MRINPAGARQIAQLDNDRMPEVTRDLRDTQAKMLEVIPKAINARAVLGREHAVLSAAANAREPVGHADADPFLAA